MQAAIKSGLLDNYQDLSNVTGRCATTRCDWPQHSTLAVCSSGVEDMSSTLVKYNSTLSSGITIQALKDIQHPPPRAPTLDGLTTFWTDSLHAPYDMTRYDNTMETEGNQNGVPNLTDIYIAYRPQCKGSINMINNKFDLKSWRALKGSLQLCMLTSEATTVDGKFTMTVASQSTAIFKREANGNYCAQINEPPQMCTDFGNGKVPEIFCFQKEVSNLCMDARSWGLLGRQITQSFSGTAFLARPGKTELYSEAALGLTVDILGKDPIDCSHHSSHNDSEALEGFEMRLRNVAISITNLYVMPN